MIEQAIAARLYTLTPYRAAAPYALEQAYSNVGEHHYHMVIDQTATYPQGAFMRVSTLRYAAMGANAGVATCRVQVNVYGSTALQAQRAAIDVRAVLSRFRGVAGGIKVQGILDEAEHTDYDADIGKHRVILEFLAHFEE